MVVGLILITGFFGFQLSRIEFDYEFDRMFPENDPETELFKAHVEDFGENLDFLYLLISDSTSLFRPAFMKNLRSFEEDLKRDSAIVNSVSPASTVKFSKSLIGPIPVPLLSSDSSSLKQDSIFVFSHPFYQQFFGKDRRSLFIYLSHQRATGPGQTDEMLASIRRKAEENGMKNLQIIGPAEAQSVFISFIQKDFTKFLFGSVLLCFTLLMIIFRDFRSAMLPFIISIFSVIWLFGMMVSIGIKMNLLTTLLPPIVFFVAMSDVIHLMNSYKKSGKLDKAEKLMDAFKVAWRPTLLTSITTAIGFLSLLWINTEPIQEMGILAALGVLIAFVVTYSLGAVYLVSIPVKNYTGLKIPVKYAPFVRRRKWQISAITLGFILITVPGIFMIETDAYILDDLPRDAEIRTQFANADAQIGGVKTFELRLETSDTEHSFKDEMVLAELLKLHYFIQDSIGVARIQSPVSPVLMGNSINDSSSPDSYRFPQTSEGFELAISTINRFPEAWNAVVSKDGRAARIVGSIPDEGTERSKEDYKRVRDFVDKNIDSKLLRVYLTGATYLIDITNDRLSGNLMKGLASAVLVIAIFLGLFFRSWKLLLISLIPNLIPLLVIAGIVGWFGISLKMTSAIIFTVAFGIAVDDTIHFMSYYVQNLKAKNPMEETFRHAGSAMLITTLVMMAGFALFMTSSFGATYIMGLFVSLALLIALIIDFTLLPLIMDKIFKNESR